MKTAVVYGSKYGTTQKCAEEIAKKIKGEVEIINLKDRKEIQLEQYDKVIIGSSIYAGMIRREVKGFCEKYKETLSKKKVAIFLCCMDKENVDQYLKENFNEAIVSKLIANTYSGGGIKISRFNFLERFMIRKINEMRMKEGRGLDIEKDTENIVYKNIESFVEKLNRA